MQYLRDTTEMPLTICSDGTNIVKCSVNGSYTVHTEMHSQTDGTMLLGKGAMIITYIKQRMNTKRLIEWELFAADDQMPHILWMKYFLKWQGYNAKDTILYQDNNSAILLDKNGNNSSSKRTKPISIWYYFSTDRVKADELNIEYCPTRDMVAEYFTKPLQGKKCYQFHKEIVNLKD